MVLLTYNVRDIHVHSEEIQSLNLIRQIRDQNFCVDIYHLERLILISNG